MKKRTYYVMAAMLAIVAVSFVFLTRRDSQTPQAVYSADKFLVVGTSDDYPPYTFSQDGKVVGFDIDLVQEVAQRMGRFLILKTMAFDILLLELQRGTIQIIAAGLTPTTGRAQKVLFTSPYISGDPLLAVTRAEDQIVHSLAQMQGKTVVVNEGYTADFYLSAYPQLHLEKRETVAECLLSLERYKADVYVVAQSAYQPFLKTKGAAHFRTHPLSDVTEKYALAVSKKYPLLFEKVEEIVRELREDGTIDDLKKRWDLA